MLPLICGEVEMVKVTENGTQEQVEQVARLKKLHF